MSDGPPTNPAHIDDVRVINGAGPWNTKSGGELNVLFQIPFEDLLKRNLRYVDEELIKLPLDIRGLRAYTVSNIPKGTIGANEWHRVRRELVFCLEGSFVWTCEDLFGKKKEFTISGNVGVENPPFILHTYKAQTENSKLLVIANTLFNPSDPTTHDTFSAESFSELSVLIQNNK